MIRNKSRTYFSRDQPMCKNIKLSQPPVVSWVKQTEYSLSWPNPTEKNNDVKLETMIKKNSQLSRHKRINKSTTSERYQATHNADGQSRTDNTYEVSFPSYGSRGILAMHISSRGDTQRYLLGHRKNKWMNFVFVNNTHGEIDRRNRCTMTAYYTDNTSKNKHNIFN